MWTLPESNYQNTYIHFDTPRNNLFSFYGKSERDKYLTSTTLNNQRKDTILVWTLLLRIQKRIEIYHIWQISIFFVFWAKQFQWILEADHRFENWRKLEMLLNEYDCWWIGAESKKTRKNNTFFWFIFFHFQNNKVLFWCF